MKRLVAEIFETTSAELGEGYIVTFDRNKLDPIPYDDLKERLTTAKQVSDKIVTKLVKNKMKGV